VGELALILVSLAFSGAFYKLGYEHGQTDLLIEDIRKIADRVERRG
jgi:hypothetical protein